VPAEDIRVREGVSSISRRSEEMVVTASPARVAVILAGTLGFALLPPGAASLVRSSVSATMAIAMVSMGCPHQSPAIARADR
jgi:hypothetical protein